MHKVKVALIGLAVVAISLLLPTLAMAQETAFTVTSGEAEIRGIVYEADGVTPIPYAEVMLLDGVNEIIGLRVTDEDGSYTFGSVETGSYQVVAQRTPGEALTPQAAADSVPVASGETHQVNFTLDLPGSISGFVYAADGVTPLDAAAVYVYDYMSHETLGMAFTAPDGWYSVDALTPGEYLVQAMSVGTVATYAANQFTIERAPPIAVTGGLTTEGVNFALQTAAYFSGIVTEEDGTTPIADAAVYAYDFETDEPVAWVEAGADGKFDLAVPEGTYRLTAYKFDYKTSSYNSIGDGTIAEAISIVGGETRAAIAFQLAGVGVVSGSVYQPDGVTPANGVSVLIYDSPTATVFTYSTTTLANGTFSRSVLEGTYYFSAVSPTDGTVYFDDKLTLSVANPVTVPPNTQVGNINMQFNEADDAAGITATINLQGRPAKPHPSWSVPLHIRLTPDGETDAVYDTTLTTDQNGGLIITGIPPGTYRIWVKHSHTLANAVVTTLVTGNNNVDMGTLREGDADNDNRVILADFSLLANSFGKALGQEGYDPRVDFNMDNAITLPDFSLLATNFNQQGVSP